MKKTHLFVVAGSALLAASCAGAIALSEVSPNNNSGNIDPSDVGGGGDNPVSPTAGDLKVTFDFNGGEYDGQTTKTIENVVPTSYFYYIKKNITENTIDHPEHYDLFKGYSLSPTDSTNLLKDDYVIKDNITVYAQYGTTEDQCEVSWADELDSGKVFLTEKYFEGETPNFKGTYPFHAGFAFDHWDPEIHPVTDTELTTGVTYTAKYLPSGLYHTVTIDPNNGGGSSITQSVADKSYATEPKVTYTGHHLDKWVYKTGPSAGQTFTFNTQVTEDLDIQATWAPDSCNITYVTNGGTFLSTPTSEVDYGKTITSKPSFQDRPGYDKDAVTWYTTADFETGTKFEFGGEGEGTEVTTDLTLFAKWPDINSATYSFYDDETKITTIPDQIVKYGEKVHRPADPVKEGYTFDGWFANSGLTTPFDFDAAVTCEELTVKIYAKFTAITYRVTYNAMGGTITTPSEGYVDVGYKGKINVPPTLVRPGYDLSEVEWHVGSTTGDVFKFGQDEGTEVTSNLTLYATWGEIKKYTVTFYDDAETPTPYSELGQTVNYGDKVQRPVNPAKTGYTFSGWYTEKALTNEYNFDTTLTVEDTTELNLYAKFTENSYRVTLNPNGGTIQGGTDSYTVNYGETIENAPIVTKEDCAQPTWYTDPDFTTGHEFIFGAEGVGTPVTEDITIYAKYEIKEGESFTGDSWKVFLNEINGKSYEDIAGGAYKDDYESSDGKSANTFVGLTRNITITDVSGHETNYEAVIVDENKNATQSQGKFTFMFVSNDTCAFDRVKNYYPDSDLAQNIGKLSYGIQAELKGVIKDSLQACYSTYPERTDNIHFKLFTPSVTQIFGDTTPTENEQFAYFKEDTQTKASSLLSGAWLRTPYEGTQGYSYYVDAGVKTACEITDTHKVCAAFVI